MGYDETSPRRDTSVPIEEEIRRLDGVPVDTRPILDRLRRRLRLGAASRR